jgi:hypothetical protein
MCDWEGCTTGTIELPNPNQRHVKTSGFLHPYIYRYTDIYRYTARVPRDRFLALEGEGITWMRQPSRQGIALFSVHMEFWRSRAVSKSSCGPQSVFRLPIVNRGWRQQADTGVTVFLIVPVKKPLTESAAVLDAAKAVRELRPIFHGAECGTFKRTT